MARQRQKKLKGFLIRFGIYHVRTDPVTRKQMSTKCTDSEAALSWLANRQRMAQQPAVVASHFATVGDWIDKFLAQKKVGDVRPETVDFWRSKCKNVLRLLGREMPLSDITPGTIDDYIARRRSEIVRGKPVRGYTAKREILALIAALRLAKRADKYEGDLEKLLPENLEASYKPRERALTEREVSQLIHAMPNYTWGALVAVCVGLGCRKSEAFRLRPEDVEVRTTTAKDAHGSDVSVERMFVWIDGRKTEGSNRIVPVLSGMRPLLEYALPHLPVGELGNVARTFSLACQRAQIERCSPNDLRRTHATLIGKRGVKNEFIAGLLGHSSTAMAERVYNQARADDLAPVVEELLSRAAPIEFGALGGDALKSKATPGRKRGGGTGTGGGSEDLGDMGGPFDGSDLDGDGPSEASSAVGRSCTVDATFSRQCSGTMSFRGAPRKIRTCDLWLRRPGHPSGETAAASNPADSSATDGNLTHVNATTCNDVSATLCPDGTADADHGLELGSTRFSSQFESIEARGRSPDLDGLRELEERAHREILRGLIGSPMTDGPEYRQAFLGVDSAVPGSDRTVAARVRLGGHDDVRGVGSTAAVPVAKDDARLGVRRDLPLAELRRGSRRTPLGVSPESTAAAPTTRLVRTRANGLREYSTSEGSSWGWA